MLRKNNKNVPVILLLVFITPLFHSCTTEFEPMTIDKREANFSESTEKWGSSFAKTLKNTVKEAKEREIELSDIESVISIAEKNTLDVFQEVNYISTKEKIDYKKTKSTHSKIRFEAEESNLSSEQKKILNKIDNARKKSNSYIGFSNKLLEISDYITYNLPSEEQAVLLDVISVLYYSLDSMNELVKEGVLPGKPEGNDITLAYLNLGFIQIANAEDGSGGWWDDWGRCAWGFTKVGLASASVVVGCSPPAAGASVGTSCYLAAAAYIAASASLGSACN